ncbi:MAG: hypothetical protein HRF49_07805 [bacterium]|jgi:hypothetical protein
MSSISPPDTEHLLKFLRAYLGERITAEYNAGGSHRILSVDGCESDIAVTLDDPCIPMETLRNILRCAKISFKDYSELAGTPKLLKAYLKKKKRETKDNSDAN